MRCRMCGRKITDPESMQRGFGPQCWEQMHPAYSAADTEEIVMIPGQMELEDWLRGGDEVGRQEEQA